jgi:cell division protein FtsA
MQSGRLIVVCDLGTTQFRTVVARTDGDGFIEVLGTGCQPAAGFRDGDFVDVGAGFRAISRSIKEAEAAANVYVSGFYYNVSGSHLRTMVARSQLRLEPSRRFVTQQDIDQVMSKAHSISIPFDHSILIANPIGFTVDGIGGIVDPNGRKGSYLEVEALLISGSRNIIANIEDTIAKADSKAVGWCIDVLASSSLILSNEEKQQGVLFVDVGGKRTDWILYRDGVIAGCGMVPCGGDHLSSDLAHGLRVSLQTAETVKMDRGVVLRSLTEQIDTDVLFSEAEPEESPGLIAAILQPRMEEIFTLVKRDAGADLRNGHLGYGLVLSGGGARCRGSIDLCEEVFDLAVEYRDHRHLNASVKGLPQTGSWLTAMGLVQWALGENAQPAEEGLKAAQANSSRIKKFLGGLFS